ncbi:hypothetical protein [Brevibacillus fortis]|uniref:hypothetical protein n=1 Tax=Brevibacillus fortis TaxID=2126352 RepID=UPI0038FCEC77
MFVIEGLLIVSYILLLNFTKTELQRLKMEVNGLPKSSIKQKATLSPVGNNVKSIIVYPQNESDKYIVYMFVSPSCVACHGELEDYLNSQLNIPFICLLESSIEMLANEFMEKYHEQFPIIPIYYEDMKNINVVTNPTFLIVNAEGDIEKVFYIAQGVRTWYSQSLAL